MKIYLLDDKKINMYSLPRKIEDPYLINYITENGLEETIRKKTGLPIDSYFSATKISWILSHIDLKDLIDLV